ncbi:hypothetical protein NZD89_14115 [Alicyclobacillus fastidiosus]|uniref:Uncharacterized protein n=1 Tax=Alicyclobacillus fastidiosus TaxID=392011 RepID=A0ABY6ZPP8_9BACL|nr:hypothetical protein [Alicyclobacillus fastidiosus]WAH44422.1 hypothetical protein NZD89_14115 [Alicyclobacillus fastidiosus]GMA60763.1 hypothetical protein GCM10025859_12030 [Alicyclobacillus fastidiosus]
MGKVTHSRIKYGTELKCRKSKPQYSDTLLGTWDVLQGTNENLKELGISQSVIDFANLTRDEVVAGIPGPRPMPEDWSPKQHPQYHPFAQLLEEAKRRFE